LFAPELADDRALFGGVSCAGPSKRNHTQPDREQFEACRREMTPSLVACSLPGRSKRALGAWQKAVAPAELYDLFHPGPKPLTGFYMCTKCGLVQLGATSHKRSVRCAADGHS
jgi:hypothetical protein